MNSCLFEPRLDSSDSIVMRVVIQKVLSASVSVDNKLISKIGKGVMCLVGIRDDDDKACSELIAKKILVRDSLYCNE